VTTINAVIPAQAGIHPDLGLSSVNKTDSGLRWNDNGGARASILSTSHDLWVRS